MSNTKYTYSTNVERILHTVNKFGPQSDSSLQARATGVTDADTKEAQEIGLLVKKSTGWHLTESGRQVLTSIRVDSARGKRVLSPPSYGLVGGHAKGRRGLRQWLNSKAVPSSAAAQRCLRHLRLVRLALAQDTTTQQVRLHAQRARAQVNNPQVNSNDH